MSFTFYAFTNLCIFFGKSLALNLFYRLIAARHMAICVTPGSLLLLLMRFTSP